MFNHAQQKILFNFFIKFNRYLICKEEKSPWVDQIPTGISKFIDEFFDYVVKQLNITSPTLFFEAYKYEADFNKILSTLSDTVPDELFKYLNAINERLKEYAACDSMFIHLKKRINAVYPSQSSSSQVTQKLAAKSRFNHSHFPRGSRSNNIDTSALHHYITNCPALRNVIENPKDIFLKKMQLIENYLEHNSIEISLMDWRYLRYVILEAYNNFHITPNKENTTLNISAQLIEKFFQIDQNAISLLPKFLSLIEKANPLPPNKPSSSKTVNSIRPFNKSLSLFNPSGVSTSRNCYLPPIKPKRIGGFTKVS